MTPYLKGNSAGDCPECGGTGRDVTKKNGRCRTCKGRGIIGKTPEEVISEMTGKEPA